MAFCIAAGVFIRLPLLSPLSCSFSHPIRFRPPKVVAEGKVFCIQKEKNQVIKRFKAIMYLKSGSWPEISDIEFNLLKYAQEATPLLAKLSKKKRSSWPLHVEIFCSNCCPSGSSLRDVILPTSMLIMNFRNRQRIRKK